MTEPSAKFIAAVEKLVQRDLNPSMLNVQIRFLAAILPGGLLSLFLCGQFGFGFLPTAVRFNHALHHSYGPVACALVCGGLFAIIPTLVLRLTARPMLFRVLLRHHGRSFAIWLLGAGTLLAVATERPQTAAEVITWGAGAVLMFRLIGHGLDWLASLNTGATAGHTS